MIVMRRRRFLPGTPINTSWRCLEMSMATNKVEAVVSMAVIAGLLSGVVCAKPLLRPETRLWPPATQCEGCARGHNLKQALLPDVLRNRADLECHSEVVCRARDRVALHRARQTHAERLRGEFQRADAGRVAQ